MSNYLQRSCKVGIILLLLLPGYKPGWSQPIILARNVQQRPEQPATGNVRQLKHILNEFNNRYGVNILFELSAVEGLSVGTESISPKATLEKNLDNVLKPLGLRYKKVNSTSYLIVGGKKLRKVASASLTATEPGLPAQPTRDNTPTERIPDVARTLPAESVERTITGVVKSEADEPLPGVSVVIKGTTRGTTTDASGGYRLTVPDEAGSATVLVFSFVGYLNQEVSYRQPNGG